MFFRVLERDFHCFNVCKIFIRDLYFYLLIKFNFVYNLSKQRT